MSAIANSTVVVNPEFTETKKATAKACKEFASFSMGTRIPPNQIEVAEKAQRFCTQCNILFKANSSHGIEHHASTVHKSEQKPFYCPFPNCDTQSKTRSSRRAHIFEQHVGKIAHCGHCKEKFSSFPKAVIHLKTHAGLSPKASLRHYKTTKHPSMKGVTVFTLHSNYLKTPDKSERKKAYKSMSAELAAKATTSSQTSSSAAPASAPPVAQGYSSAMAQAALALQMQPRFAAPAQSFWPTPMQIAHPFASPVGYHPFGAFAGSAAYYPPATGYYYPQPALVRPPMYPLPAIVKPPMWQPSFEPVNPLGTLAAAAAAAAAEDTPPSPALFGQENETSMSDAHPSQLSP